MYVNEFQSCVKRVLVHAQHNPCLWITSMQIACPETQWNILVYFLRFGSNIFYKYKKTLIGHKPKNKYSITCVHQSVFSQLKKMPGALPKTTSWWRLRILRWHSIFPADTLWLLWFEISTAETYFYYYLILKNIAEFKNAVTSNINFYIVVQLLYK